MSNGVEYSFKASATGTEAISAALAADKARKINGDDEQIQNGNDGVEAVPSSKKNSTLIMSESDMLSSISPGVRLHHRAVCVGIHPF